MPDGSFLSGLMRGMSGSVETARRDAEQTATRQQQQELKILETLANSDDPEIRSIATTGMLSTMMGQKKQKGLRGFLGEVEQNPILPQIQRILSTPVPAWRETRGDNAGGGAQLQTLVPQDPGSAAMPQTSLVQPGAPPPEAPAVMRREPFMGPFDKARQTGEAEALQKSTYIDSMAQGMSPEDREDFRSQAMGIPRSQKFTQAFYRTPEGQTVEAIVTRDGAVDALTHQPLPAGSVPVSAKDLNPDPKKQAEQGIVDAYEDLKKRAGSAEGYQLTPYDKEVIDNYRRLGLGSAATAGGVTPYQAASLDMRSGEINESRRVRRTTEDRNARTDYSNALDKADKWLKDELDALKDKEYPSFDARKADAVKAYTEANRRKKEAWKNFDSSWKGIYGAEASTQEPGYYTPPKTKEELDAERSGTASATPAPSSTAPSSGRGGGGREGGGSVNSAGAPKASGNWGTWDAGTKTWTKPNGEKARSGSIIVNPKNGQQVIFRRIEGNNIVAEPIG